MKIEPIGLWTHLGDSGSRVYLATVALAVRSAQARL